MFIRPQPGPQTQCLSSAADIVIFGGGAGGGKSWALLLEPLRHVTTNPGFFAVFFRRTTVQVRNPGGLWDESVKLYGGIAGAQPVQQTLEWRFTGGGRVKFAHLEHEINVLDWQGAQVPLLIYDELTHFTAKMFWYLLSRNRSMCGVRPYIRATCNPDADSWVAELVSWWIAPDTGLPMAERSGVLRWFVRINDALEWADDPAELAARHPDIPPKSLTFIPSGLDDNPALVAADPGYRANLLALPLVDRERLLGGNWKIRPSAGLLFKRGWCEVVDAVPAGLRAVRGWDLAGTPEAPGTDPDWTCGTKIAADGLGRFYVLDHVYARDTPGKIKDLVRNTASADGADVAIALPQDPAQAGKFQAADYVSALAGYTARAEVEGGNKATRFGPFSAQAEAGNVKVLRAPWNERWFGQLEAFPDAKHDDDADSTATAFRQLTTGNTYDASMGWVS